MNDDGDFPEPFRPPEEGRTLTETVGKNIPTAEAMDDATESVAGFNRLLWEIAKTFTIFTLILLLVALLVIAYYAAEFMVTL